LLGSDWAHGAFLLEWIVDLAHPPAAARLRSLPLWIPRSCLGLVAGCVVCEKWRSVARGARVRKARPAELNSGCRERAKTGTMQVSYPSSTGTWQTVGKGQPRDSARSRRQLANQIRSNPRSNPSDILETISHALLYFHVPQYPPSAGPPNNAAAGTGVPLA